MGNCSRGHSDHALAPHCPQLAVPGQSGARCSPSRSALAAPAGPACPTAAEGELAVAGWRAQGRGRAAKRCIKPQRLHAGVDAEGEGQEHSRTVILARAEGSLAPREDQRLGQGCDGVGVGAGHRKFWGGTPADTSQKSVVCTVPGSSFLPRCSLVRYFCQARRLVQMPGLLDFPGEGHVAASESRR